MSVCIFWLDNCCSGLRSRSCTCTGCGACSINVVSVQLPEPSPPSWRQHGRHIVSVYFHHEEPACCGPQWSGCRKGLSASAGLPQVWCVAWGHACRLWKNTLSCHAAVQLSFATAYPCPPCYTEPEKTLCDALWPASLTIQEVTWLMWVCIECCGYSFMEMKQVVVCTS